MTRIRAWAVAATVGALSLGGCSSDDDSGGESTTVTDEHGTYHQVCIDKINALRATKGLSPYTRWLEAESCVDQQSTSDEQSSNPHGAFGQCNESSQNECLGSGMTGIEGCLDAMWGEKDQAGCSGCDACADALDMSCPNCSFYGPPTCGHYVNMSAKYYTQAACGFSALGSWATIDFR